MARGDTGQVPILLQSALQLDSDFAMAHLRLGEYYSWIVGNNEKASKEFQLAYDRRQGVTNREQRRIEAEFYTDQERYDEAAQSLSVLVSLYPDDADAHEASRSRIFQCRSAREGNRRITAGLKAQSILRFCIPQFSRLSGAQ